MSSRASIHRLTRARFGWYWFFAEKKTYLSKLRYNRSIIKASELAGAFLCLIVRPKVLTCSTYDLI